MKKQFLLASFILLFSTALFANTYKVISVVGKPTIKTNDTVSFIIVGQDLDGNDYINVPLNSELKLSYNDKLIKISSMRKGLVSELASPVIKKVSTLKSSTIAPDVVGTTKGVATAASRASEAKEDISWDEE